MKAKVTIIKQIIDDIRYEITREEILKEIKPLDVSVLEKIGSFAYFEEFISDDLLEKAWKMPWGWGKNEAFESNKAEMTWNLRNKTYCPKDWRDFK